MALEGLLFRQPTDLGSVLHEMIFDGGLRFLPEAIRGQVRVGRQFREFGYSGYELIFEDHLSAKVEFTPLQFGGFAVHKLLIDGVVRRESWEIYGEDGSLLAIEPALTRNVLFVDLTNMEPACPVLAHLYNYLAHEYEQAGLGSSRSRQVHLIECFLRDLEATDGVRLGALDGASDEAVRALEKRMLTAEADPVLDWEERQKVILGLIAERRKTLRTKRRAHRLSRLTVVLPAIVGRAKNFVQRVASRPGSNLAGLSYKYTIGLFIWFMATVKNNIGYSIALAIYGPFTFYFITQPLNPHAMWAVGKVRSAYLEATQNAKLALGIQDSLVTAVAATSIAGDSSEGTAAPSGPSGAPEKRFEKYAPALGSMLVGTDIREVDNQDWSDRMSHFKAMQIGMESNLEFAARMGRIEQMETQLNYPMIADSAWQELERYSDRAAKILAALEASQQSGSPLATYLRAEISRSTDITLYIWDRMVRFILDHPYVVMDLSGEQVYRDYYLGRAFILLKNMTDKLGRRFPNLSKPADYKKVERLAQVFEKSRVEGATVLERLKNNSRLFSQKDRFDGHELRGYMKRQWEILYLLQMKAQEASNFGLSTYTWSIRNALWSIQSIYSTKSRELGLLFPITEAGTLNLGKAPSSAVWNEIHQSVEPLYESAFHLINLDYVSLRPELSERLENDIEFVQRRTVIERLEKSFEEREAVLQALRPEAGARGR
jgi:hypothetical protein